MGARSRDWCIAVVAFVTACARAPQAATVPAATRVMSAADSIRCAAVADSLLALPPHELPLTQPPRDARLPQLPRPPANAGTLVQTMFVVRPDGTVDTSTVTVAGTDDPGFRSAMVRVLSRQRFEVPTVHGCPAWSRGDIRIMRVIERIRY